MPPRSPPSSPTRAIRPGRATSWPGCNASAPRSRASIVAEHERAILGFIAVHAMPRFEHDDWILRILALVVDAGARERGVGRALMAEAERIGRELGRGLRRADRRPPSTRGTSPVRVARLRLDGDGLPAQEALTDATASPSAGLPAASAARSRRPAARPAVGAAARRPGRRRPSTSATCRSGRRATSSGSSWSTA